MSYADEGFYTDRYLLGRKPAISAGFDFYAVRPARSLTTIRSAVWRMRPRFQRQRVCAAANWQKQSMPGKSRGKMLEGKRQRR